MAEENAIIVDYDEFINAHEAWAAGESDAASDAGKRRQEMGEFQKRTNLQSKAMNQVRAGLKIKKEGERKDWFRSLKVLMSEIEPLVMGQGTSEMPLEDEAVVPMKSAEEMRQAAADMVPDAE